VDRAIDIPWQSNEEYSAFVSLGSFIKGWTVIFPKNHQLNMSSHYKNEKFWNFVKETQRKIENLFGPTVMFEHGAIETGSQTGCGTDHAHIHLVPIKMSFRNAVQNYCPKLSWKEVKTTSIEREHREYLLFSEGNSTLFQNGFVTYPDKPLSQFFRRVLSSHLGIPHLYDYKRNEMIEVSNQSLQILHKHYPQSEVIS